MREALTRWAVALVVVMAGSFSAGALAQAGLVAVPPYTARVTDLANVLQAPERAQLEARLASIEQHSGSQVAVLTVPTTVPEDIAAYGIRVADAWKAGRKSVDDGVLLIVAVQDRKMRIEVGRGLEGAIPDAIASRIIRESITPDFQRGAMYAGIAAGVERIAARIGGEALPPPAQSKRSDAGGASGLSFGLLPLIIFIGILLLMFRGGGRRGYYSRGSGMRGVATGMILDSILRSGRGGGRFGGGGFGGGGGGGFGGGGGGGFGGGGASGGW